FFFFSSRRRHTRFSRDWSSDVCSSDLRTDGGRRFSYESLVGEVRFSKQCVDVLAFLPGRRVYIQRRIRKIWKRKCFLNIMRRLTTNGVNMTKRLSWIGCFRIGKMTIGMIIKEDDCLVNYGFPFFFLLKINYF